MTNTTIKVLVADDHALMRMGLKSLLETQPDIETVGEASDGGEAVRKAKKLRPDVVIMDIMMPGVDGIAATREIAEALPGVKVLILTTSTSSDELNQALQSGAAGAVLKSEANRRLLAAIRAVAKGEHAISDEVRTMIDDDPPAAGLTPRQLEILQEMVRGLTNKEIAVVLNCSPESVKDRIAAICAKLGATNRSEAIAIAMRKHLLKA